MYQGFIAGSRATLTIDVLVIATVSTALLLAFSIFSVRVRRNYQRHRSLQVFISVLLLIVLIVFETSVRLHDWQAQAESSAFYVWLSPLLTTHIIIAITAVLAWVTTLSLALRRFPKPPAPAAHSRTHKRLALLATVLTYLTASSGLLFYLLAFVF